MRLRKRSIARAIATGFYVGYFPLCPGTCASFLCAVCCYLLPECSITFYVVFLLLLFFIGVWATTNVEQYDQRIDGSYMVIDEYLGMMIALINVPKYISCYALVFILFRFFDITKLYPISLCERYFKGGFCVMIDDVMAAFMTQIGYNIVMYAFLFYFC